MFITKSLFSNDIFQVVYVCSSCMQNDEKLLNGSCALVVANDILELYWMPSSFDSCLSRELN
jgi:hypothetical protein